MNKIKQWWKGKPYFIEGVYPGERYKRHWSSDFAHLLIRHLKENNVAYLSAVFAAIVGVFITQAVN